jgi:glycosyltransferase involved in cell wall biosynthesis
MSQKIHVSIILPVLKPNSDLLRCIASIKAALENKIKYEILCISRDESSFNQFIDKDFRFIKERKSGIYAAMNQGVENARGIYLYFIGQDDLLLPSAAQAIINGLNFKADLILSDVFWGSKIIYKNYSCFHFLVWKNWCHQGVLYNRKKFIDSVHEYPVQYKVQADHYANIIFSSIQNLKIYKFKGCIAWYSSDGFSSCNIDINFREAFPALIHKHFGVVNYYIVIIRRLLFNFFKKEVKIE